MCVVVPGSFTAVVSECDPLTGLYSITGQISIVDPPGQTNSGTDGYVVFGTTCSGGGSSPYVATGPFPDVAVVTIPYTITGLISNGVNGCIVSALFYNNTNPTNPVLCTSAEIEFNAAEPCLIDFRYYEFTNCCTQEVLSFGPGKTTFVSIAPGTYLYTGPNYQGLETNTCYTVSNGTTQDPTFFGNLPDVPANSTANYTEAVDCNDTTICPGCDVPCYRLYSCDGTIPPFNTYTDLSAYVGEFIEVSLIGEPSLGCFYVQLTTTGTCADAVEIEVISQDCNCECTCYTIIGEAKAVFYLNCETGEIDNTPLNLPQIQICSQIYPVISGPIPGTIPVITSSGPCENDLTTGEWNCPPECFVLTDCAGILDPIYATKPSLSPFAILGQVLVLDNYPGTCWEITDTAECDCAIDVVVLQSYEDCPTCLNAQKYKLINCDNETLIVYTSTDLSAYVGQVITRLDCPGCWYVEEIEDIPSDVPITVDVAYVNCIECARDYYLLTDCTGYKDPIITYTDLSQYVGSTIKIKYCPETCWTVTTTPLATNAGIVIPDVEYEDCEECLLTFPCICTTVRNDSTTSKEYEYYDCELVVQTFILTSGETSERFCIRTWAQYYPETDYIETFGNCTETTPNVWNCPPVIYPRRSVQPGYNTPACTIAKYEKISCRSADVYYKQVLYLRYGISDCCPDENDKWLIKKELIDLDALRDPDYECTVVNPCCPNTPSCGNSSYGHSSCGNASCGCTPLIPCNSQ
jgi:hypothetical protein